MSNPPRRQTALWRARPALATILLLLAMLLPPAPAAALEACPGFGQRYRDFYEPPELGALAPGRLGEILRIEPAGRYTAAQVAALAGQPSSRYGAQVYRVLYLSQAPPGTARAVSGLLLLPVGPQPAAGFPLLAYAHGTVGLADSSAPSRFPAAAALGVMAWVAAGYAVSASDYVGLGTPGPHPYLVGEAAAYSVLDGARAALRFCDRLRGLPPGSVGARLILAGWSQGGHAALFSAELQPSYAPELRLAGTIAYAPAAELRGLLAGLAAPFSAVIAPAVAVIYGYQSYYPGAAAAPLLQPAYAADLAARAESSSLLGLLLWLGFRPDRVFAPAALDAIAAGELDALAPWPALLDANSPGGRASPAPTLIFQGAADVVVPAQTTAGLVARICAAGGVVAARYLPGVGHGVVIPARAAALAWAAERIAGAPAASDCAAPPAAPAAPPANTIAGGGPLRLSGAALAGFLGVSHSRIAAYRYAGGVWAPVAIGWRAAGPRLAAADELAAQAADLGDRAPPRGGQSFEPSVWAADPAAALLAAPPAGPAYELTARDPRDPAGVGYLYLFIAPAALAGAPLAAEDAEDAGAPPLSVTALPWEGAPPPAALWVPLVRR